MKRPVKAQAAANTQRDARTRDRAAKHAKMAGITQHPKEGKVAVSLVPRERPLADVVCQLMEGFMCLDERLLVGCGCGPALVQSSLLVARRE